MLIYLQVYAIKFSPAASLVMSAIKNNQFINLGSRHFDNETFRDSGIIDASDTELNLQNKSPNSRKQYSRHASTPEKILESKNSEENGNSFAELAENSDAEHFWNGFLQNGFSESSIDNMLRTMSVSDAGHDKDEINNIQIATKEFSSSIADNKAQEDVFATSGHQSHASKHISRKNSKSLAKFSQMSLKIIKNNKKRLSDRTRKEKHKSSPNTEYPGIIFVTL